MPGSMLVSRVFIMPANFPHIPAWPALDIESVTTECNKME